MKHQADFQIAGLNLGIMGSNPIRLTEPFLPFETSEPSEIGISFRKVTDIPEPEGKEVFRDGDLAVYDCAGQYIRVFCRNWTEPDETSPQIYAAASYDWDSGEGEVQYTDLRSGQFEDSKGCFTHMGFEDLLMSRKRLTLHASLVETDLGGILFSGVSGIGKSTQADLWHRYEGASILNGDRPILSKIDGRWVAHGSPFAGSSHYYVNQSVPIRAVILLEQGSSCNLRRMGSMEAFCGLYAGTTINVWNSHYVTRTCDLLDDLTRNVPVYHYSCTADAHAVATLKTELLKGDR